MSNAPSTEPFRGSIDAGGGRTLWVETRGAGPDVLLLGGLTDPVESWQFQLDGLSDRYRLIAFDNAGAGRSPLPPESEPFDSITMADDAVTVLRAVGVDGPVHVAGFSGGTQIGQQLALRHPDVVRSLVLVSTFAREEAYFRAVLNAFGWLAAAPPGEAAELTPSCRTGSDQPTTNRSRSSACSASKASASTPASLPAHPQHPHDRHPLGQARKI